MFTAVVSCMATSALAHPGHPGGITSTAYEPGEVLWVAAAPVDSPLGNAGRSRQQRSDRPDDALTNQVSITLQGDWRVIRSNGIPDHEPGRFPNRGNPNRIGSQHYEFRVPAQPKITGHTTPLRMQPFGVAVNGVVFDPGAAEWWRGDHTWQYEPMSGAINLGVDQNNAHVQPNGAYHYHAIPTGLLDKLTGGQPKMVLVGWAADGFPMYGPWGYGDPKDGKSKLKKLQSSYRVKRGSRPSGPGGKYDGSFVADYEYVKGLGDLDECNGRYGVTPEFSQGTYYYVLTEGFPYVPRMYSGTPDLSFMLHGPGGGRGGPGGLGPPRRGNTGRFGPDQGFTPRSDRRERSDELASSGGSSPLPPGCPSEPSAVGEDVKLEHPRMHPRGWPPPPRHWGNDRVFGFAAFPPPPPPPFPGRFPSRLEDWTARDWDRFLEMTSSFTHVPSRRPLGWPPPPPPFWGGFPPPPPMIW